MADTKSPNLAPQKAEDPEDDDEPQYKESELVDVPIFWKRSPNAQKVYVYCSTDNFKTAYELNAEEKKTKTGKTKRHFDGLIKMPPGKHLIRFQVDGEWKHDDQGDVAVVGGEDYNRVIVTADGEQPEKPHVGRRKSLVFEHGSLKVDSSGRPSDVNVTVPASPRELPTTSPKKSRTGSIDQKAPNLPFDTNQLLQLLSSRHQQQQLELDRQWKEAWFINQMRLQEATHHEKEQMRATWAKERALWLSKIKESDANLKAARDQLLVVQTKLEAAEANTKLGSSSEERNAGRASQEAAFLKEQIERAEKRIEELKAENSKLQSENKNLHDVVEEEKLNAELAVSELKAKAAKATSALEAKQREIHDLKHEIEVAKSSADQKVADLEKEISKMRQANLLKGDKEAKLKNTLKSTFSSQLMTTTLELDKKEKELVEVKRQLAEFEKAHETAKVDLAALQQKVAQYVLDSTKASAEKRDLTAQRDRLQDQLTELKATEAKQATTLQNLRSELDELKKTESQLRTSLDEAKAAAATKAKQLQDELEAQAAAAKAGQASASELAQRESALQGRLAELTKRADTLDQQLAQRDSSLQQVQASLAEAKRKHAELESELTVAKKTHDEKVAELQHKHDRDVKQIDEQKAQVSKALEGVNAELDALKKAKKSSEDKLQSEIDAREDQLRQRKKELDFKQMELEEAKDSAAAALEKTKTELKTKLDERDTNINLLKREIETQTKAVNELKAGKATLADELAKTKSDLANARVQIEQLDAKVKDGESKIKDGQATAQRLEDEKKAITQKLEKQMGELEQKLKSTQTTLMEKQANLDKTIDELEKEKAGRQLDKAAAERQKVDWARQVEEANKSKNALKTQVVAINKNAKAFHTTVTTLRQEQTNLQTETVKAITEARKFLVDSLNVQGKLLAETMAKYKKELSERRKYFNLVQELRGNIRVFCRCRPVLKSDDEKKTSVAVTFPVEGTIRIARTVNNKDATTEYEFDKVFDTSSTQVQVFNETGPLINSVMDGYNVCIFAYGQTGSGKTHTMNGYGADPGVNTRALTELFRIRKERAKECDYKIMVSMKEVYNEKIRDLLAADPNAEKEYKVRVGENGMYVEGLTLVEVQDENDVQKLMEKGAKNRSTGVTNMNEHSSRSHSLLSIEVVGENKVAGIKYSGKLHLIDLAGSERLSKTGATGDRLKEAQAINKSLSALGNVISALQKKDKHVPYRDSKLTYLLQDSLGGQSKTLMFVNCSPTAYDAEETNNSLLFASRVRKVELGAAKLNAKQTLVVQDYDESAASGDAEAAPADGAAPAPAPAPAPTSAAASSLTLSVPSTPTASKAAPPSTPRGSISSPAAKTPTSAKPAVAAKPAAAAAKPTAAKPAATAAAKPTAKVAATKPVAKPAVKK